MAAHYDHSLSVLSDNFLPGRINPYGVFALGALVRPVGVRMDAQHLVGPHDQQTNLAAERPSPHGITIPA